MQQICYTCGEKFEDKYIKELYKYIMQEFVKTL